MAAAARRLQGTASGASPQPRRVGGGRRVGNRGGNQGRSRHRRAPAFPHPASASPPRLTPPLSVTARPWPRPRPASGLASERPLPGGLLKTPPPALHSTSACAPTPSPSRVLGSARLVLPASLPRLPSLPRDPLAFELLRPWPPCLDNSLPAGKVSEPTLESR